MFFYPPGRIRVLELLLQPHTTKGQKSRICTLLHWIAARGILLERPTTVFLLNCAPE
jgi:hypothetical protein